MTELMKEAEENWNIVQSKLPKINITNKILNPNWKIDREVLKNVYILGYITGKKNGTN